jgi:cell division protein FtsW
MAKRVGVDKWLYGTVLVLVLLGLVMVFSSSAIVASEKFHSASTFVVKQAIWACLGLITMNILMNVDYRRLNRPKVVFVVTGVTLLLLLVVFAMRDSHATHRWIRFGPFFSFQPSEFAKPAIVLFLAWFLQSRIGAMDDWRHSVMPAVLPVLIMVALILKEPDLGTALVCLGASAILLYLARLPLRYYVMGAIGAAPVLYYMLFRVAWRRARILAFLHPDANPRGAGYHVMQSLIAVGTGGFSGVGLMEGKQKLFYLPESHTDFIFANIAEELGLLGTLCVVGLFAYLGYRGFRAAMLSRDPFAQLLAVGVTSTILVQACFNMSVVLSLVPTKGIPLPFISSGGTSLFITLASMGVLLNITREIE